MNMHSLNSPTTWIIEKIQGVGIHKQFSGAACKIAEFIILPFNIRVRERTRRAWMRLIETTNRTMNRRRKKNCENRTDPCPHSWITWYLCLCYFHINLTFESHQLWWLSSMDQMIWTSRRLLLLCVCGGITLCVCVCAWRLNGWVEFSSNWKRSSARKIFSHRFRVIFLHSSKVLLRLICSGSQLVCRFICHERVKSKAKKKKCRNLQSAYSIVLVTISNSSLLEIIVCSGWISWKKTHQRKKNTPVVYHHLLRGGI